MGKEDSADRQPSFVEGIPMSEPQQYFPGARIK